MISVLCPTRGRPNQVERMVRSARVTAKTDKMEFVFYFDNDDASVRDVIISDYYTQNWQCRYINGPRIVLSNMWNKCAEQAVGDILMQGNDDIVFRTQGWDEMVEAEFAKSKDKILMVHGSDGNPSAASGRGNFAVHPFIHRRWVETVGYFTSPCFSSDFGDTWLNDLANAIDRRRYLPFVIEHLHIAFGKAREDATTADRLKRHNSDNVGQLYADLAPLRDLDIEKLKAAIS